MSNPNTTNQIIVGDESHIEYWRHPKTELFNEQQKDLLVAFGSDTYFKLCQLSIFTWYFRTNVQNSNVLNWISTNISCSWLERNKLISYEMIKTVAQRTTITFGWIYFRVNFDGILIENSDIVLKIILAVTWLSFIVSL